jgi:hypothetical protein
MEVDGISMAHIHVAEAKDILQQLGLPTAQTDERSAWTLLALVDVSPEKTWRDASNPMRGITATAASICGPAVDEGSEG